MATEAADKDAGAPAPPTRARMGAAGRRERASEAGPDLWTGLEPPPYPFALYAAQARARAAAAAPAIACNLERCVFVPKTCWCVDVVFSAHDRAAVQSRVRARAMRNITLTLCNQTHD